MSKNVSKNHNMELTDHVNFSNFVYLFKSMKNLCRIIWCTRSLWYTRISRLEMYLTAAELMITFAADRQSSSKRNSFVHVALLRQSVILY